MFLQARSRLTGFACIGALLAEQGGRRWCWQLGEIAGHATPRRMQALLAEYRRDWKSALTALQRFIVARLGDGEAIVVLDETAELKKGDAAAGAARQHAGITGQVENFQTTCSRPASPPGRMPWSISGSTCRDPGARTTGGGSGRTFRTTWSSPPGRPRALR